MRQQRNNEAKELIGSRVGTAKAIFNQNSASGQMLLNKSSAPIKPVRNSIAQRVNVLNQSDETSTPIVAIAEDEVVNEVVKNVLVVTPEIPSQDVHHIIAQAVDVVITINKCA